VEERYHPLVVEAHTDYIRAGARAITTNNYAIQPTYYRSVFEEDWAERVLQDTATAVRLAQEARRVCEAEGYPSVRILGCLPPLVQTFRPDLTEQLIQEGGTETYVGEYRRIATALVDAGVDGLLGETLNGWQEARLVVEATKDLKVPLVVCLEGTLRGTDLKPAPQRAPEAVRELLDAKLAGANIEAIGFNCAPPEDILVALQALESAGLRQELYAAGVELAAYANCNDTAEFHGKGFNLEDLEHIDLQLRQDCIVDGYVDWCLKWMNAGATYVGGCCGTSPSHIRALAREIEVMPAFAIEVPPPPLALPGAVNIEARSSSKKSRAETRSTTASESFTSRSRSRSRSSSCEEGAFHSCERC